VVLIGVDKIVALLQSCCSQTTFAVVVAVAYDDTSDAGETTAGWGLKWIYGDVDSDGGDVVVVVVVHDRKVVGKIVIDCERRVVGL